MKEIVAPFAVGDCIVMSGGVVWIAEEFGEVALHVPEIIFPSVSTFYVNHPNVHVFSRTPDEIKELHKIPENINVNRTEFISYECWDKYIYRHMAVPFSARFDYCPIAKACEYVSQVYWPDDVALVHDDVSRDLIVRLFPRYPIKIQRVWNDGNSILQFAEAIINACEGHYIDSSFMQLANCLPIINGPLYWHRYARFYQPGLKDVTTKHKWIILDDPNEAEYKQQLIANAALQGIFFDRPYRKY